MSDFIKKCYMKFIILALCLLGAACLPGSRTREPLVVLTWHKGAYRLAVLLREEYKLEKSNLKVKIGPRDPLPYSHNASAAVWVGIHFPHEKAIEAIRFAKRYYKELRYFALSDRHPDRREAFHYQLFIGGSTETALNMDLRAWTEEDFVKLETIKTKKKFHDLIRSKYERSAAKRKSAAKSESAAKKKPTSKKKKRGRGGKAK